MSRSEVGHCSTSENNPSYVFKLTAQEINKKEFFLKYSPVTDSYIRPINEDSSSSQILKHWKSGVNEVSQVFMKKEHDWKMVYLARTGIYFLILL